MVERDTLLHQNPCFILLTECAAESYCQTLGQTPCFIWQSLCA